MEDGHSNGEHHSFWLTFVSSIASTVLFCSPCYSVDMTLGPCTFLPFWCILLHFSPMSFLKSLLYHLISQLFLKKKKISGCPSLFGKAQEHRSLTMGLVDVAN